ncbi:MAG TPA: dihydrolipoamide acetyltransferase family protein [Stellaceae bacterium]|nr:dihydrolipoamide acetyltransferase family protein [Stellaceae bacterium]
MAQRVVKLPDIGEGTTEAEIVAWRVKPGDVIQEEDPLAEVMTDKATVEIPAPVAGRVVAIHGRVGERLAVGSDLVVLEVGGGEANGRQPGNTATPHPPAAAHAPAAAPAPAPQPGSRPASPASGESARAAAIPAPRDGAEPGGPVAPRREAEAQQPAAQRPPGPPGKPLASPAVRKRAWDLGIALQFVPGSGPAGRITQQDLDAFVAGGGGSPAAAAPRFARRDGVEDMPIVGLRRAIAEHMQEAARRIPHFAYVEEVDVTALEELRAHLNETRAGPAGDERPRLTLLPFLMRAIANAVLDHPQVNARFDDETGMLHRHRAVNIGIATQTPGGLLVPVVRHAEALDLWQAAAEIRRLSEAARAGKATREELAGSTITITSLGRLGGIAATPVINHPEVAIVGVNRIVERPVARAGQIVLRQMMNLSSSFDHRIVDGWEAASFVAALKSYLEQPATLFID